MDGAAWTLEQLWSPLVAITAADGDRANGLIASTAVSASLLPEAPRVLVELAKASLTHDLVLASGCFALHLLPASPLETSLALFRTLGMRTGREEDKLAEIPTRPGVTGSPILTDALSYLEARVAATLDGGELTIVLADVVAGERLRDGDYLTIELVRESMPAEWAEEWEARRQRELADARPRRRA